MNERISLADKKLEVTSRITVPKKGRKTDNYQSMNSPVDRILFLQRTIGNQAVMRLLKSEALHRKSNAGESRQKICPKCSREPENGKDRPASTVINREIKVRKDGGEKPKEKKPEVKKAEEKKSKKDSDKCPKQTVTMSGAKCGSKYGAVGQYCYSGAKNWWFKEKVKNASGTLCQPGDINQTSNPFQNSTECVKDEIFDNNGPPSKVAPCTDTTFQTVFAGPTKADVEQCQYPNTQVIEVTVTKGSNPKSGKVITSSAGESTECNWS